MKKFLIVSLVLLGSFTMMATTSSPPPVQEKEKVCFVQNYDQAYVCDYVVTPAFEVPSFCLTKIVFFTDYIKPIPRFGFVYRSIDYENSSQSIVNRKNNFKTTASGASLFNSKENKHRIRFWNQSLVYKRTDFNYSIFDNRSFMNDKHRIRYLG